MLNAKEIPGGGNRIEYPVLEEGTYPARLVEVSVLGVLEQMPFKGEQKDPRLTMRLTYELSDEFLPDEDGEDDPEKPRFLSEEIGFYNLEVDRATSTKKGVTGLSCLVNLVW